MHFSFTVFSHRTDETKKLTTTTTCTKALLMKRASSLNFVHDIYSRARRPTKTTIRSSTTKTKPRTCPSAHPTASLPPRPKLFTGCRSADRQVYNGALQRRCGVVAVPVVQAARRVRRGLSGQGRGRREGRAVADGEFSRKRKY